MRTLGLLYSLCLLSALSPVLSDDLGPNAKSPRIVNIINFVRQVEPRIDWITEDVLYDTVVEQVRCMEQNQLRGTFLLQYDALKTPRYRELFRGLPTSDFEIGVWWEIPQPLVEDSGLEWRGRYPWDWHADVGFATGYTPKEREALADTFMEEFRRVFGKYPKSVGSWFIDAHTLSYLRERYQIEASCNCKDQIGTDGYTLWGGYWNQGYYPSRRNAYMPAQTTAGQIDVPVFRMLGSDPIHQYDSGLGSDRQRVISLEPVYPRAGGDPRWCRWYFDEFVRGEPLEFAYVQAGQENSFTWRRMGQGFQDQMQLIRELHTDGKVTVATLGETGAWFRQRYKTTPATAVTVLSDLSEKRQKTVWYNSRNYRANLLWEGKTLRFRDIHLFDEAVASNYLKQRGTTSRCDYDTLPVVDGFRWSQPGQIAGLYVTTGDGSLVKGGIPTVIQQEGNLKVTWPVDSPKGTLTIELDEERFEVQATGELREDCCLTLQHAGRTDLPFLEFGENAVSCFHKGSEYRFGTTVGTIQALPDGGFRLTPKQGRLVVECAGRSTAE